MTFVRQGGDALVHFIDLVLSLKPRTESKVEDQVYKVNERITTLSYEGHVKYSNKDWF